MRILSGCADMPVRRGKGLANMPIGKRSARFKHIEVRYFAFTLVDIAFLGKECYESSNH
jgi:hypothetical protein